MSEELKEAAVIYARADAVDCPHCGAAVNGWSGDPRGTKTNCDECGKPFKVAATAEVKLV